jgi:hypothetical protein
MGKENELTGKNLAMSRCQEIVTLEMRNKIKHVCISKLRIRIDHLNLIKMGQCRSTDLYES